MTAPLEIDEYGQIIIARPDHSIFRVDLWSVNLASMLIATGMEKIPYPANNADLTQYQRTGKWILSGIKHHAIINLWPHNRRNRKAIDLDALLGCLSFETWAAQMQLAKLAYAGVRALAENSLIAGKIANPDTPANWLAWAKSKNYCTKHLEPDAPKKKTQPAPIVEEMEAPQPAPALPEHTTKKNPKDWDSLPDSSYVSMADLTGRFAVNKSTVYRWVKDSSFPKQVSIGKSARWLVSEVKAWEASRK